MFKLSPEFIVFRPLDKTWERLTLKLHHTKVFESSNIKYLGLNLYNKLSWKFHIAELSKKLSRSVGLCPITILRFLYYSLLNSHLCYGLLLWVNANQSYID